MKIKKIELKNYKLLNFKLIKTKILKKNHYLSSITLKDVEFRLKKILHLIYLYHLYNKKILFIGNPLNINNKLKQILFKTKHIFIPKSAWISGLLTNQNSYLRTLFKEKTNKFNKITEKIIQLKKKSDLIVIVDQNCDLKAIEEGYKSQIPVISLNSDLNIFNSKISYKIPGNFILPKNKLKNNFFYSMIISTIKKAYYIKQKFKNSLCLKSNTLKKIKNIKVYNKVYNRKFYNSR